MLNSESRRLSSALESVTEESDRRFSDLFNLTTEMFEDQVRMDGQSCNVKEQTQYVTLTSWSASPTGKVREPAGGALPMLPGHQFRRQRSPGVHLGGAAVARGGGGAVAGAAGRAEAEADAIRPGQGCRRC